MRFVIQRVAVIIVNERPPFFTNNDFIYFFKSLFMFNLLKVNAYCIYLVKIKILL